MNKAMLIGMMEQDATFDRNDHGLVACLNLAVTESWRKNGEWKSHKQWIRVRASERLAEACEKAKLAKGNLILVDGRLHSGSVEQADGRSFYSEVHAWSIKRIQESPKTLPLLDRNDFTFIGRLGSDPVSKEIQSGPMVSFDIACDDYVQGEKQTEWVRMAIFNRSAESAAKILSKGRLILVEGRLRTATYQKNGTEKQSTGIVVNHWRVLDKKPTTDPPRNVDCYGDDSDREDIPF